MLNGGYGNIDESSWLTLRYGSSKPRLLGGHIFCRSFERCCYLLATSTTSKMLRYAHCYVIPRLHPSSKQKRFERNLDVFREEYTEGEKGNCAKSQTTGIRGSSGAVIYQVALSRESAKPANKRDEADGGGMGAKGKGKRGSAQLR